MSEAVPTDPEETPRNAWLHRNIGTENIDNSQGGLLLLNHESFLDPLVAAFRLRRPVSYLARHGLFEVPVLGWILRRTYVVPVNQMAFRGSTIRAAVERMDQGFLVGIFPEGERTFGKMVKFNRGFLALVRRVDLPIYPVGIVGAGKLMPMGSAFIRPGRVTVVYGEPISDEQRELLRTSRNDAELAEMMRQCVADCMARADQPSV
jgi:1-acyl-sn-glycerol-3-phosphate acyltransferase